MRVVPRRGFTLIQISILLTVASLVMVTLLPSAQTGSNANNVTTNRMNAILTAMRDYQAVNAALPCPADASQLIGSTSYGVAAANPGAGTNCSGGSPAANYVDSTNHVAIGMVPVRALSLSNDYALDTFGRDITYAVDTNATGCYTGSLAGQITVTDNGTNNSTIAALVSHGADGHGAWIPMPGSTGTAVRLNAGSTDTDQLTNAHVNASFTPTTTLTNFVRKPPTTTFDDLVVYRSTLWTLNKSPSAASGIIPALVPPANGNYTTAQTLAFSVTYGAAVTVTGTPRLALTIGQAGGGSLTRYATYTTSAGNTINFSYTVVASDYAPSGTGISMSSPIALNGGTISVNSASACLTFTPPSLTGVLINPSSIYVVDSVNNRVEQFNTSGTYLSQIGCATGACTASSTSGQFNTPQGGTIDASGNVWVADRLNERYEEFNSSGTYLSQGPCASGACAAGSTYGKTENPYGVAIDGSGNIWEVDYTNDRLQQFNSSETFLVTIPAGCTHISPPACAGSVTNGHLTTPEGIKIDAVGNIWVTDTGSNRVQEFNSSGTYLSGIPSAGCPNPSVPACTASSANGQFSAPWGIAVDGAGNVWVADAANNRVEEFNSGGSFLMSFGGPSPHTCETTPSGTVPACAAGSGQGQFSNPTDVAIDGSGNFWVTDSGNNRIQEFSSCGTYLAGLGAGYNGVAGSIGAASTANGGFSTPLKVLIGGSSAGSGSCIASVTPPSNGAYTTGQVLTFTVSYSTAVAVTGTPELVLTIGSNTRYATYASGSGTTTLTFTYTIQASDAGTGISSTSSISLNGGTITGVASGSGASLTYTPPSMAGIVINASAFMLVADSSNNRMQQLNLSGTWQSQLGCATGACATGFASGKFDAPFAPAVDSTGNIWVTDPGNNRVEKFNSSGTWQSTIPSSCANSAIPACAASAGNGDFNGAQGIAVDPSNNVWVADWHNDRVEEFASASSYAYALALGSAGTASCAASYFTQPRFVHSDSSGNIYVADATCDTIQEFSYHGGIYSYVKTFGPSITSYGTLSSLQDFAFDSCGNFWMQDTGGNNYIVETDYAGNFVKKVSVSSTLGPKSIAIDGSGTIYSLNSFGATASITTYNSTGTLLSTLGAYGTANGQFETANGLTLSGTNVTRLPLSGCSAVILSATINRGGNFTTGQLLTFTVTYDQAVTVTGTPEIAVTIAPNTRQATYASGSGTNTLTFSYTVAAGDVASSIGVASSITLNGGTITSNAINSGLNFTAPGVSAVSANTAVTYVYVGDYGNNRIQTFSNTGTLRGQFVCTSGACPTIAYGGTVMNEPSGVTTDSSGNVWEADVWDSRVQKFDGNGNWLMAVGGGYNGVPSGGGTGATANGQFNQPEGVVVDSAGNVWVADTINQRVQKFNSSGTWQMAIGSGYQGNGSTVGTSGAATTQFSNPYDIAVDGSGNIYVPDSGNNRVSKFNSSGTFVSEIPAGCANATVPACAASTTNGHFNFPDSIAIDTANNVWVADGFYNRVEKFNSTGVYQLAIGAGYQGKAGPVSAAGSANGVFSGLGGIRTDSSNNVWVTDGGNNRIQEFNSSGTWIQSIGSPVSCETSPSASIPACTWGAGAGQLNGPAGVAVSR